MKVDYTDSGLSTPEALVDGRAKLKAKLRKLGLPRPIARFLSKSFIMTMGCDTPECRAVGITTGQLSETGQWSLSGGWVHHHRLDFCPKCQASGRDKKAVAAGVLPRGS